MALLSPIYWQAITPAMREVLRFIGQCPFAERFYLAGGTALALRLGHRRSIDLDFFSDQVKQFFIEQAQMLGQTWFEGQEE